MGFNDDLTRMKDGSYILKHKSKKSKDGDCIECGENTKSRDLLFRYNAEDMLLVRNYIGDHLTMHPKHKSVTPDWCSTCEALKQYIVNII